MSSGKRKPMANCGLSPNMPKAITHRGVVSIPKPPPSPALDTPMNSAANPTISMGKISGTREIQR